MTQRPPIIAVLTDRYYQYQSEVVDHIASELNQIGYGIVCIAAKELHGNSETSTAFTACNSIYDQVNDFGVQGVIVLAGTLGHGVEKGTISRFLDSITMPKVSFGLNLDNIPSVYFKESKGMTELMHHLTKTGLRKKFAFVRGQINDPYSLAREAIFLSSLRDNGCCEKDICYVEGNYNAFTTYHAVLDLLATNKIDCIVAANDVMAASAARAAKVHGLCIPNDIAISGFDDSVDATSHSPAITTVRQPLKQMATDSVKLLLEQIEFRKTTMRSETTIPNKIRSIHTEAELIVRRSTNPSEAGTEGVDIRDEPALRQALESAMHGLVIPHQLTMRRISEPLWNTLSNGTVDIISFTTNLSDDIIFQHAHWWMNLCDQIDAIGKSMTENTHNIVNVALVNAAISNVKERIWAQETDQHFEATRLQNVRSSMQLALSSCNDINDIVSAMDVWLEQMQPHRCFLVQYKAIGSTPNTQAKVIHIFKDGTCLQPDSTFFHSNRILPSELAAELGGGLLVFSPVHANNQLFGYLLVDPTDIKLHYIDAAAESIGDAMRTQHHIKKLQSVNEELARLANFDALTGLANRLQFQDYLQSCIKKPDSNFALLFIDLDGFKLINDTLGHGFGDQLLNKVAQRLIDYSDSSPDYDGFISRLGGDEFTVVLHQKHSAANVQFFCQQLLSQLAKPFMLNEHEVSISGSIGCALYPEHAKDADTLVVHADIAMYRAKENGKNSIVFFCSSMNSADTQELELAHELRQALLNNKLSMHFQPRIDLKTGRIHAAEALMRWLEPSENGEVVRAHPDTFIALAEKIGMISQLDTYALHYSCRQAALWADNGTPLKVSVNVSVNQLQQENFVATILNAIEQHKLDPALLELEITETAAMTDVEFNIAKLSMIKEAGIEVSIDDFGTGYSSLNYLKRLPVHNLKIDRSFIMDITDSSGGNSADAAIVRSVVALGKSMEFGLIAEGIETEEQHHFVRSLDCDQAQGYLYARPMSADDISALLNDEANRDHSERANGENPVYGLNPVNNKAA